MLTNKFGALFTNVKFSRLCAGVLKQNAVAYYHLHKGIIINMQR